MTSFIVGMVGVSVLALGWTVLGVCERRKAISRRVSDVAVVVLASTGGVLWVVYFAMIWSET